MNSNSDDMENSGGFIKEFLDRECEADAALRARLEALLAARWRRPARSAGCVLSA